MTTPLAVDFETPISNGFSTVATFIPKLIGFLLILVIGYFIAKLIAKVVDKVLERVGFDGMVERGGIKKAMAKSKYDASDIVSKLVFFAIFIPVLSAAIGTLGIQALQEPLAAFIALIPRIIVAIVLVVIGAVIAGAVKTLIQNTLGGLSYGKVLANAASILILLGFVKSALDQVGIATSVTGPLLYAILGTVAGVLIVVPVVASSSPCSTAGRPCSTRPSSRARTPSRSCSRSRAAPPRPTSPTRARRRRPRTRPRRPRPTGPRARHHARCTS
jgi:hypothetical protein